MVSQMGNGNFKGHAGRTEMHGAIAGNRCVTALEATLPRCQALTAMDLGCEHAPRG